MTSSTDLALMWRCLDFAAKKHSGQIRKDQVTPYINHPIGAACILANEAGQSQNIPAICATVLHDTVEDTNTTNEEIRTHFGEEMASLVAEVTDKKGPKAVRKQQRVDTAHLLTPNARLVLMADKLYNIRDCLRMLPFGWTDDDRQNYLEWVAKVIRKIRGSNEILEGLIAETLAKGGITL